MHKACSLLAAAVVAAVASFGASSAGAAVTVAWASLNSEVPGVSVSGTIAAPSGNIGVTYTGDYSFAQLNNIGTDYWIDNGYTQGVVNRPPLVDIIALNNGGLKTITFSQAVTNPYIGFVSWNGNTVDFSSPYTIISQGCGYWGCGSFVPLTSTSFFGNGELHGVLQFQGTFTSISFTDTSENWHGINVGVDDIARGVPEPATWAMMILGVFLAGAGLRAARRKTGLAAA